MPAIKKETAIGVVMLSALGLSLAAWPPTAPSDVNNLCKIFTEKRDWYQSARQVYQKWGVPIHVQMAIVHQESRFLSDAKPPRQRWLGFIPTSRPSTAYGYAQVIDKTWNWYAQQTGNRDARRDEFDDAVNFIGWYGQISQQRLGISKWDAYQQYLAYHEGHGGFSRKTYLEKAWLMQVAHKVANKAQRYINQLEGCQQQLDRRWRWWPFYS